MTGPVARTGAETGGPELPPRPDGPSERDRARAVVEAAEMAHAYAGDGKWRSAEAAFFHSWALAARGAFDDAEECEHRRLAWDRVEQTEEALAAVEAKLRQIAEIVASAETRDDDAKAFAFGRIEEVLAS